MNSGEKLIRKFLTDKTRITSEDCDKLLTFYEYKLHKKGGSHRTYHKKGAVSVTIVTPKNSRYVNPAYVNLVIKYLKLEEL